MLSTEDIKLNPALPLTLVSILVLVSAGISELIPAGTAWRNFLADLSLSASWSVWLNEPWTLLTYIFLHRSWLHLAVNMLWLWLICDAWICRYGPAVSTLWILYPAGSVGGGLAYMTAYSLGLPSGDVLIGSSTAVLAVVSGVALISPRLRLRPVPRLPLFWIAVFIVIVDLIGLIGASPASHIAHLGGIVVGLTVAALLRRYHVRHDGCTAAPVDSSSSDRIDTVLRKMRQSGYSSLTRSERETLARTDRP